MQKTYFHNTKHFSEKKVQIKNTPLQYINQKRTVDINKLLNRVRIDEKNETKRKIIFYSLIIFGISLFGCFIAFFK